MPTYIYIFFFSKMRKRNPHLVEVGWLLLMLGTTELCFFTPLRMSTNVVLVMAAAQDTLAAVTGSEQEGETGNVQVVRQN